MNTDVYMDRPLVAVIHKVSNQLMGLYGSRDWVDQYYHNNTDQFKITEVKIKEVNNETSTSD